MPTPNDDILYTRETADSDSISRTGCPPEDERLQSSRHADDELSRPRTLESTPSTDAEDEQRRDTQEDDGVTDSVAAETDDTSRTTSPASRNAESAKAEHVEDASLVVEPSSPVVEASADPVSESEARLAQSMSATAISLKSPPLQYVHFPDAERQRLRSTQSASSFLRPGSKFRGTQQSDRQVYDVQVEIKDVDLAESFICGYLRIQGLTDDHPTLTTFFEGEIIGDKYTFKTAHSAWNSSEKIDLQHWARFPAWKNLAKSAKTPNFSLRNYLQREHLFMRWKEYFLVPDHRVKTITGASFEGFYYICFNQCSGSVSGIYFHAKSEKYQQLELKHVNDHGCMSAVDFR